MTLVFFILLFRFKPDMNRGKTRRYTMPQDETCLKIRKKSVYRSSVEGGITKNSTQTEIGEARIEDRSGVQGRRQDPGEICSESAGWVIRVSLCLSHMLRQRGLSR